MYKRAESCRCCGATELRTLFDFGHQPLAGHFPLQPEREVRAPRYPLDLSECQSCGLLQVTYLPPIDEVFHADYRYSSSTVPGLVRHFAEYAGWLQQRLSPSSRILEFGCNDGVLLAQLRDLGFDTFGVDASANVGEIARQRGLDVHTGFFTPEFVTSHGHTGRFDAVTCSNVFAHIHDVRSCAHAAWLSLREGGSFFVEVHNADSIFSENQFDTIYHEHLTYYTGDTLGGLLAREGFEVQEVARTAMHGDGLRVHARRRAGAVATHGARPVASAASTERSIGDAIASARARIEELHGQHGPLAGFGAAGRSQMFLNFTGTAHLFEQVFDDSPLRQGRYIAGSNLPIRAYAGEQGRCCVILAWNYAPDISRRIQQSFGEVVTVLPALRRW